MISLFRAELRARYHYTGGRPASLPPTGFLGQNAGFLQRDV